jgi:hypothetical protein
MPAYRSESLTLKGVAASAEKEKPGASRVFHLSVRQFEEVAMMVTKRSSRPAS